LLLNFLRPANSLCKLARLNGLQTSDHVVSQQIANLLSPLRKRARTQVGRPNRIRLIQQCLPPGIEARGCQSKRERKNERE
jgi:hypothetical protein